MISLKIYIITIIIIFGCYFVLKGCFNAWGMYTLQEKYKIVIKTISMHQSSVVSAAVASSSTLCDQRKYVMFVLLVALVCIIDLHVLILVFSPRGFYDREYKNRIARWRVRKYRHVAVLWRLYGRGESCTKWRLVIDHGWVLYIELPSLSIDASKSAVSELPHVTRYQRQSASINHGNTIITGACSYRQQAVQTVQAVKLLHIVRDVMVVLGGLCDMERVQFKTIRRVDERTVHRWQ